MRNFNEIFRKMELMTMLKVTKNQGINLSLEDTIFEKPQGKLTSVAVLGLEAFFKQNNSDMKPI